ncbi:MAG: adenylate/guanylate cyclase domain-containing protein [Sciscionella sp.]
MPQERANEKPDDEPTTQPTAKFSEQKLERELLGGERRYTRRQVAEQAGLDFERARRLWVAMGFAEVSDSDVVFTDNDVEAVRVWDTLVRSGVIGADTEVSVARALGQAFSGIAEWQVGEITERFRVLAGSQDDANAIAAALIPVGEYLHNYIWRRHLAAAAGRALSSANEQTNEQLDAKQLVVGFADIVGYTTVTRHSDSTELAELLETFESDAASVVAERHGRVVKTVGDEILFVVDSPRDAAEIALRLTEPDREQRGLSILRVGMAMGRVLSRHGDVYGSVVNLAARLTSAAKPGTALVDRELADELRQYDGYRLRVRRPVGVRGYHHMRSWALRRTRL